MTIQSIAGGGIELKSKLASFSTASKMANDVDVSSPGEYEVADLSIRIYAEMVIQLNAEGISVAYIEKNPAAEQNEIINELRESDILIMKLSSDYLSVSISQKLIQAIEPKVIIPTDSSLLPEFCQLVGSCPEPIKTFKITKSQLINNDEHVVLLT